MIFGRGGGGGIVNRVLKRPSLDRLSRADRVGRRLRAAIASPATSTSRWAQSRGSRQRDVSRTATASATTSTSSATESTRPSRCLGPDTRIDLSYEYFHDRRTADRGVPADGDEPIKGYHAHLLRRSRRQLCQGQRRSRHARGRAQTSARPDAAQPHAVRRLRQILPEHLRRPASTRDRAGRRSAPTTTATTARTCSARPTSSGRTASAGIDQTLLLGLRAWPREVAQFPQHRQLPRRQPTPITDPTVDADVIFAPDASDANNRVKATVAAALHPGPDPPAEWSRSSPACASTASGSTSTICAPSTAASSAAATICGRRASD